VSDLYAVLGEYDHGLDEKAEVFGTAEDAIRYADRESAAAEKNKVPVAFAVYRMVALSESGLWDWGHETPQGTHHLYVHERAARSTLPAGWHLARKRKGSDAWERVTSDA
jgi:hypothetical protein